MGSSIKSIQRGNGTINNDGSYEKIISISINTVDPNKCMVILNTNAGTQSNNSAYLLSLESNMLKINVSSEYPHIGIKYSWQIIEFR